MMEEVKRHMMDIEPRMCNVAHKVVEADICYEIFMCLTSGLKPESVPEADFRDDEQTRKTCRRCPHFHDWD